jgi:RNA polymerase sigma-70 factor (ECF subfamily)
MKVLVILSMMLVTNLAFAQCKVFVPARIFYHDSGYSINFDFYSLLQPKGYMEVASAEEAEDATQEVLVKLWNKKETIEGLKSSEAMAMAITKNYCLDQLKSRRASNLKIVHSNYRDKESGVYQKTEDKDSWSWVEKLINELPENQRLIIQMRDIEAYEFEEIAEILQINEAAIRVTLSRARKTIREKMTNTHNYGIK